MGIATQRADVVHRIAGGSPCAEARSTDIDSVGTVVDGGDATFQILGRSQQFEGNHFNLQFDHLQFTIDLQFYDLTILRFDNFTI